MRSYPEAQSPIDACRVAALDAAWNDNQQMALRRLWETRAIPEPNPVHVGVVYRFAGHRFSVRTLRGRDGYSVEAF